MNSIEDKQFTDVEENKSDLTKELQLSNYMTENDIMKQASDIETMKIIKTDISEQTSDYQLEKIAKNDNFNQMPTTSNVDNIYICKQCNYKASYPIILQHHFKSVHEGIKFPFYECEHCNYKDKYPE